MFLTSGSLLRRLTILVRSISIESVGTLTHEAELVNDGEEGRNSMLLGSYFSRVAGDLLCCIHSGRDLTKPRDALSLAGVAAAEEAFWLGVEDRRPLHLEGVGALGRDWCTGDPNIIELSSMLMSKVEESLRGDEGVVERRAGSDLRFGRHRAKGDSLEERLDHRTTPGVEFADSKGDLDALGLLGMVIEGVC